MQTEKPKIRRTYVTLRDGEKRNVTLSGTFYNVTPEEVAKRFGLKVRKHARRAS